MGTLYLWSGTSYRPPGILFPSDTELVYILLLTEDIVFHKPGTLSSLLDTWSHNQDIVSQLLDIVYEQPDK